MAKDKNHSNNNTKKKKTDTHREKKKETTDIRKVESPKHQDGHHIIILSGTGSENQKVRKTQKKTERGLKKL